jgi:hypothetical protein
MGYGALSIATRSEAQLAHTTSYDGFRKSEDKVAQSVTMRANIKPHLAELVIRD